MADARAVNQTAPDHQPAHGALQRAEREEREGTHGERARETTGAPEQDEWDQEHDANRPGCEPMQVLPEKDDLELRERHAGPQLPILRELTVPIERLSPLSVGQWRNGTDQRLPVDNRES